MADTLTVKLGADTTEFRSGLNQAGASAAGFAQETNNAGKSAQAGFGASLRSLHTGLREFHALLVAGGAGVLIKEFFASGISYAENFKGAITANIAALYRFREAYSGDSVFKQFGANALGVLTQIGEAFGSLLRATYEWDNGNKKAFSEAITEWKTARAASVALAEIEREKAKNGQEYLRITASITEELKKQKTIEEQTNLKPDEIAQRRADEYAAAVKARVNYSGPEIGARRLDEDEAKAKTAFDQAHLDWVKRVHAEQTATLNEFFKRAGDLLTARATETRHVAETHQKEIAITDEMKKQQAQVEALNDAQGKANLLLQDTIVLQGKAYGPSSSVTAFEHADTATLKSVIARSQREIKTVRAGEGYGATALADAATNYLPQNTVIARLQTDIQRAEYQLKLRSLEGDKDKQLDFIGKGIDDINKRLHTAGFYTNGLAPTTF